MKDSKTLQELTTILQTLCHDGWSHNRIYIRIYEGLYKVEGVYKTSSGIGDKDEKVFFEIKAEPIAER